MRRRGGQAITSGREAAVTAAEATVAVTAASQAVPPAMTAPEHPSFPAVSIPTLDIFSRFQSKRGDFDESWLMMQEDPVNPNKAPPISEAVAMKLRRHQQLLGVTRGMAGSANQTTGHSSGSGSSGKRTQGLKGGVASERALTGKTLKAGEDFSEAAVRTDSAKPRRTNPMNRDSSRSPDNDDDDDDEVEVYVPEGKDAAQYQRPAQPMSDSAADELQQQQQQQQGDDRERQRDRRSGGATATGEEGGIQGDFLNFLPKNLAATADNPNADARDLQAVVSLSPSHSTGNRQPWRGSQSPPPCATVGAEEKPRTAGEDGPRREEGTLAVPLWCLARVKRFGGYYPDNRLVALHQELCDFVDFLRPTTAEIAVRRYVECKVKRLSKRLWPKSKLIVYGSLYTHLLLPLSDVDMTLSCMPVNVTCEEALTALASEISREGLCQSAYPQVILKTKVPLVKFQHRDSLIDIDISVNGTDGKSNSDIVIHLLNHYPEAQPLVLFVKYFLQQRGMHEPYHGGLGSYAATLLVVHFLQTHPIYTSRPQERPVTGLGKLLVDFLRYCGQYWQYSRLGLSLRAGGHCFRRTDNGGDGALYPSSPTSPRSPLGPPQAIVEDPLNGANNAASSLRNYHMISSVFTNAYLSLTAPFPTAFELSQRQGLPDPGTGGKGGSVTAKSIADFSPDSPHIALRPTLLSRVLHIDADTVYRRQRIAETYEALKQKDPEGMAEAERYKAAEDAPMLTGKRALRVVSPISVAPTSPITKEEALGIASLTNAAAATAAAAASASSRKRGRRTYSSSDSSAPSSDSTQDSVDETGSNASSVRVHAREPSKRRKQLARQR